MELSKFELLEIIAYQKTLINSFKKDRDNKIYDKENQEKIRKLELKISNQAAQLNALYIKAEKQMNRIAELEQMVEKELKM